MPSLGGAEFEGGRRRSRGLKASTLRRMLKKKGMKTTGKKSTLMKRLHMRGGEDPVPDPVPEPVYTHKLTFANGEYKIVKSDDSVEASFPNPYTTYDAAVADAGSKPGVKLDPKDPNGGMDDSDGGKRRRRRSRRRREEEGGRRPRHSRRNEKKKAAEGLGY
jgi:hypothetical protein